MIHRANQSTQKIRNHTGIALPSLLVLPLLMLNLGCNQSATVDQDTREQIRFLTHGGKQIDIRDGTGEIVQTIDFPSIDDTEAINSSFSVPFFSMDWEESQLLAALVFAPPYTSGKEPEPWRHEIRIVNIATKSNQVLRATDGETPLLSPIWTHDKDGVLFIEGSEVVEVNLEGAVNWRAQIPNVKIHRATPNPNHWGGYIQLSDDGKRLYISARQQANPDQNQFTLGNVAYMDLETRETTWFPDIHMRFTHGLASPMNIQALGAIEIDLVKTLFGSTSNPVLYPRYSQDQSFYFYATEKQGFFAKKWIEGYSRESETRYTVLAYDKDFYVE